jgi:hypothetical protein
VHYFCVSAVIAFAKLIFRMGISYRITKTGKKSTIIVYDITVMHGDDPAFPPG